jgi:hypothetical protein
MLAALLPLRMKRKSFVFAAMVIPPLALGIIVLAQDDYRTPPHRSGISPPMFPVPFLRDHPRDAKDLYLPFGKTAEMFSLGTMATDELLDRVRTNRQNLYLIELREASPALKHALISPEDELVLSNFHLSQPKHP